MFDCGNGLLIPISQMCDGNDNCEIGGARAGDDETAVLCDSKSLSVKF